MDTSERVILSLCDFTGNWPKPYKEAGYTVVLVDVKHGHDIRLLDFPGKVHGILAAPPCTHFSSSGAQYWKKKDAEGLTQEALAIADACLRLVTLCSPEWWALENPVGRLRRWYGAYTHIFNPCDYGGYLAPDECSHPFFPSQDRYTKKTCLWGKFNIPEARPVEPLKVCKQGSPLQLLGGKSERTKEIRSTTPMGFARAFFNANP